MAHLVIVEASWWVLRFLKIHVYVPLVCFDLDTFPEDPALYMNYKIIHQRAILCYWNHPKRQIPFHKTLLWISYIRVVSESFLMLASSL